MNASRKNGIKHPKGTRKSSQFMPALIVAGGVCGLAALPTHALELGEVSVDSTLGQPLRASIAYALNANEQLHGYCISLRSGFQGGGAPAFNDARISVSGNRIQVTSSAAIREPLLNMQVVVDCAYTPHLVREYVLMIDPVISTTTVQTMLADKVDASPGTQSATAAPAAFRRNESPATGKPIVTQMPDLVSPIATNSTYRVQTRDTVSTIVARIDNREMGLWPAVDMIFAANPDAFVGQDVNRLIAGSELYIPDLSGVVAATTGESVAFPADAIDEPLRATAPVEEPPALTQTVLTVDDGVSAGIAEEVVAIEEPSAVTAAPIVNEEFVAADQSADLQPGDVVFPAAATGAANDAGTNEAPNVSSPTPVTSGAWNWLLWLAGSGVALILGLFLFGRKIRDRFGAPGAAAIAEAEQRPNITVDVDFEFDDTISAEAISLDADLDAGTGLDSAAQIDVAEDFGFSAGGAGGGELDMEIPESATHEPEVTPTDIIPPNHRVEDPSILDSEEPAAEETAAEDDEYDLSMIVDATKQALDEFDATAKDLHAVPIGQTEPDEDSGNYTMSSAADFETLEQDYQDELTATQIANAEMERIAKELASHMDEDEASDVTREMPAADSTTDDLSDADLTAKLSRVSASDDSPDLELPTVSDAGITAELTANLPTSIEAENDPDIDAEELAATVEMSAGSDITVEMHVESGRANTKKK